MNEKNVNDIRFAEVGTALLRRIWVMILVAAIFAGAAFFYVKSNTVLLYESDASMYIGDPEEPLTGNNLTVINVLTDDYRDIIKRRVVLDTVISELGLNMSASALRGCITVTNPSGTRVIEVKVVSSEPERAKIIADKVCEVGAEKIQEIIKANFVNIIDSGVVNTTPINGNNTTTVILAAMAGIFLTAFIIVVKVLMDDKIRTAEDVEHYLGLTVLGSIPEKEQEKSGAPRAVRE